MQQPLRSALAVCLTFAACSVSAQQADLRKDAVATMRKAATYYREQVASHGGYVYHYSLDLQERWGEGQASASQIWVQPPGTPTVGLAFLKAYAATGDTFYLEAATDAAVAVAYGQLKSGGWTNSVDFDPSSDLTAEYRNGKGRGKNNSSLDDGQTQSAIQLIIHADKSLDFKHEAIHESARIALDALLKAQFPNGGFPQVWTGPVEPQSVVKANYPEYDWRSEGRIKNYWDMYTLNDNVTGYVADTLLDAHQIYGDERYLQALRKLGDFLVLAQMPQSQPGWAQQYNYDMQPIWARRFEPPGVSGDETQEVLETLMKIAAATGERKYLEPIPAALAWLQRSLLPDGQVARYYELKSNRPLYMSRRGDEYSLTYDDSNLPDHYGWKTESRLDEIAELYKAIAATNPPALPKPSATLTDQQVAKVISELDDQGRWVSTYRGERLVGQAKIAIDAPYLSSQVFSDNLKLLSEYLLAPPPTSATNNSRKWSDRTGQFSITAEAVEVRGAHLHLRREDGKVVAVPIDKLSDADQQFLASMTATKSEGTGLTLVQDGKPTSVIVTNGRPMDGQVVAAEELQEHLRLMSGATVPIFKENELPADVTGKVLILIGNSNLAGQQGVDTSMFEPESFIVKTTGNALLLVGEDSGGSNSRTGSLWAVYDFLQDQLGCRWIWPGEIGRVVPRTSTVAVSELDIQETPTIKIRGFRPAAQEKHRVQYEQEGLGRFLEFGSTYEQISEDEAVWLRRMRMGRSFKLSYGHAFTDWWEKYKDEQPDVFALRSNGIRGPRKASQPDFVKMCVSNPKLWEMQLEPIRKYASEGARGLWLNSCENDGSGGFCVCDRCRAWDADPNAALSSLPPIEDGSDVDGARDDVDLPESLSDRYARWYNELAKRAREIDPDSKVVTYAYSRYRSPPTKVDRLESNIWVGYVGFNAYPRPEAYRKLSTDEWFGWSDRGATVFLRTNALFYFGEGAPYVATRQMAADLQFQVKNGLRATDYDNLQGYWATSGPSYYVLARMLWDTDADPERVVDEFYESFGPMKAIVKEYYDYWEEYTERLGHSPKFFDLTRADRLRAYPAIYNDAVISSARRILDKARRLVMQAAPEEQDRFRNVELGLEHGMLLAKALQDGKTSNGPEGKKLFEFRRSVAKRNVINFYWTTSKEMRYRVFE